MNKTRAMWGKHMAYFFIIESNFSSISWCFVKVRGVGKCLNNKGLVDNLKKE
jgi:hypothetical protein